MSVKSVFRVSLLTTAFLVPAIAFAHPDKPTTGSDVSVDVSALETNEELVDKIEAKLSKHRVEIAKSSSRLKREFDKKQAASDGDISEDIEAVADLLEDVFAKDGLFRDLSTLLSDFVEDVDIETEDGKTVLRFDGATIGKIETQKNRDRDDRLSISGLGKNLTLDRETIVKDGKSKTRIVIEMDGEDSVDITLPQID